MFSLTVAMSEGRERSGVAKAKESANRSRPSLSTCRLFRPALRRAPESNAASPNAESYPISGFIVHSRFPFGFIEQRRRLEARWRDSRLPRAAASGRIRPCAPPLMGRVESRAKGSGSDLYAIRRYISSDHRHQIDWKATAKTSQVMVREFTRDDDWRVTIVFDARVEKEAASDAGIRRKVRARSDASRQSDFAFHPRRR